tara:strand:- start:251 stop:622 length:372 start_codon:yes stop_codon:yes gene_type:complete
MSSPSSKNERSQFIGEQKNIIGKVKWYNTDLRYGFITLLDQQTDIFVHRNNINTTIKYKCLFMGEYVLLDLIKTTKGIQCANIRGINNDKLLCESNPDLLKKLILGQYIEKVNPSFAFFKMQS